MDDKIIEKKLVNEHEELHDVLVAAIQHCWQSFYSIGQENNAKVIRRMLETMPPYDRDGALDRELIRWFLGVIADMTKANQIVMARALVVSACGMLDTKKVVDSSKE